MSDKKHKMKSGNFVEDLEGQGEREQREDKDSGSLLNLASLWFSAPTTQHSKPTQQRGLPCASSGPRNSSRPHFAFLPCSLFLASFSFIHSLIHLSTFVGHGITSRLNARHREHDMVGTG